MLLAVLFTAGCDFNPLGGNKSRLDPTFEPGKHTPSAPPTIGAISDYTIDENDVQTIPFTINDPDTFMVCSLVFVKATSANNTIIDSTGLTVGGTYPNCTLTIAPKAYQYGVVNITVTVYDFWTYAHSDFQLNVVHILTPGAFAITDTEGGNQSIEVTWQNAAYMLTSGAYTSPYYTLYYREAYTSNAFTPISHVTSPYTVTGLTNGVEYEFYVLAHNSIGERASNTVIAEPTKYQVRGPAFTASGATSSDSTIITQYDNTPGCNGPNSPSYFCEGSPSPANNVHSINASLLSEVDDDTDTNYQVNCTGPGAPLASCPGAGVYSLYDAPENPIDDPSPTALPGSSQLSPSGKYKVYLNSQNNILSGVGQ